MNHLPQLNIPSSHYHLQRASSPPPPPPLPPLLHFCDFVQSDGSYFGLLIGLENIA
jgi:hypothetical protein